MMIRTYSRRSRVIESAYDEISEAEFTDSLSQESPRDIYNFAISSQDSSHWSLESENCTKSEELLAAKGQDCKIIPKSKRSRNGKKEEERSRIHMSLLPEEVHTESSVSTASLMETQEFGEMMESIDEVNFALDGLREGLPLRIRRASFLSLLSISDTVQKRRLLRIQGMAERIIDAILGLAFDDIPSSLAAAAILYLFTSDAHDDHLLESSRCINFLLELLKPIKPYRPKVKGSAIGSKLLAVLRNSELSQCPTKDMDVNISSIALKVQEILVNCKELKSNNRADFMMERPELDPKWLALLTIEKASLSKISLEGSSGTLRKTGWDFKEKLRELGGLIAVFEIIQHCYSIVEARSRALNHKLQQDTDMRSLALLLKCLKIMENATFLSEENQNHLLGMKGNGSHQACFLFTELIIKVIKILSDLFPCQGFAASNERAVTYNVVGVSQDDARSHHSSFRSNTAETATSEMIFSVSQDSPCFSTSRSDISASTSGSITQGSKCSAVEGKLRINEFHVKKSALVGEPGIDFDANGPDPFAFDEDDFEPYKGVGKPGNQETSITCQENKIKYIETEDGSHSPLLSSQEQSLNKEIYHSTAHPWSDAIDAESLNSLSDCLLTAIKVLMNITNDNPLGCQQIGSCGGMEAISFLLGCCFPSFKTSSSFFTKASQNVSSSQGSNEHEDQIYKNLTDQELDFLVVILGLLVNLVEKDEHNRSRLAAASISVPGSQGSEGSNNKNCGDVIPVLCSIFVANQAIREAAEDGFLPENDEAAAVLQGEREAEKMIVEAYAALLLAFLSTESKNTRKVIAENLPGRSLAVLVPILERFVAFHLTLNMITPDTHRAVNEVIESCRMP